ncbi:Zn-ribbon protein, possibly nucleic acid-binding protein [Mycolicibacterium chubuense NBB4]|uniref:Zn-ribbon protein, possibly nucleic acid-binding protein n=1 Tax=Mycolicibacterium chubuense (strain NBB4) TaxID=710421 RepID=I4BL42_MYCCN|nr:C4-type zinc ribbon domain-containing protein [Mycolicibacterium chubuense]AFM17999.1 Zn-ribbon protein, possibly nucleic acid-binding protein [Mycolicibacterium chubuense NBB4]
MKADVWQQHSLAELAKCDAEIGRIEHRTKNLPEQGSLEAAQAAHREANDRLAALQLALADIDAQVAKFESEIDGVRQREDRDRALLQGGTVDAKALTDLQHELDTLQRRQSSLEDSLLEVMERREELAADQDRALAAIEEKETALADAQRAADDARAELSSLRRQTSTRREELVAGIDEALLSLYERQRARTGVGAGALEGRRCGACRLEIDKGELARIAAAADDDVVRCPECSAILLRVQGLSA